MTWLAESVAELAECPTWACDQDMVEPSELALIKARQLLEEVSAYVNDRPDIYPMDDRSVAIDFRNPECTSGVSFLIEQDGSGALFHRTKNAKGRLRVDDAADLLREGGIVMLKRTGIQSCKMSRQSGWESRTRGRHQGQLPPQVIANVTGKTIVTAHNDDGGPVVGAALPAIAGSGRIHLIALRKTPDIDGRSAPQFRCPSVGWRNSIRFVGN